MPGIDTLPVELLVKILEHLSYADRLTCATTFKRFAKALTHPKFLKDIWFTVRRRKGIGRAAPVLAKSRRRYQNLRLVEAGLRKFDSKFWKRLGKSLRRLELRGCRWTPEALYAILRECSSLEYLSITRIGARNTLPENVGTCGTSVEDVRESLRNVKHLHLSTHSVDVVVHLLGLIPDTSSISLHVYGKEFPWETLIHRTLADSRIVTELDLYESAASDADVILILGAFSRTLQDLRLRCIRLPSRVGGAIAECSRLRRLSLENFRELENTHMTTILLNNPDLEMLDLRSCHWLSDEGLSPIRGLRKLRRLNLHSCPAITNEFLCRLGEILTLEYLDLFGTKLDLTAIRSIACLKNLKTLHVNCFDQSPGFFRIICLNSGQLQTLNLGDCENLSDADGLMLSRLKKLRTLKVRNAFGFEDLAIEGGIGGSELESLAVVGSSLTDVGLLNLAGRHGRLKNIDLRGCENITGQGLMTLLPRAPLLETLRLGFCRSIGDEFIEALGDCCPRLRSVDVSVCAISSRAMKSFKKRRPTVSVYFEPK